MGALHLGHLSLIDKARETKAKIIVSIFVNQLQFNNLNDFHNYPKNHESDLKQLAEKGVDIVFIPEANEIYNNDLTININETELTNFLCGKTRAGHFSGVCFIIAKFLNIIAPNFIILGEKDYQQYLIVKRLIDNLDYPVEILMAATYRENSGLAMSSRNERLTIHERNIIAPNLNKQLKNLALKIKEKPSLYLALISETKRELLNLGFTKIDYLSVNDSNNLNEFTSHKNTNSITNSRIFAAAFINEVRLIDNIAL